MSNIEKFNSLRITDYTFSLSSIFYICFNQQGVTLWRTRTKLEKYLIIAICTLAIAFIILLLCIQSSSNDGTHALFQQGISTNICYLVYFIR